MNFQAGEGIVDINFKSYRQVKVNLVFGEKRRVRLDSKMPRVKVLGRQCANMKDFMRGLDH